MTILSEILKEKMTSAGYSSYYINNGRLEVTQDIRDGLNLPAFWKVVRDLSLEKKPKNRGINYIFIESSEALESLATTSTDDEEEEEYEEEECEVIDLMELKNENLYAKARRVQYSYDENSEENYDVMPFCKSCGYHKNLVEIRNVEFKFYGNSYNRFSDKTVLNVGLVNAIIVCEECAYGIIVEPDIIAIEDIIKDDPE